MHLKYKIMNIKFHKNFKKSLLKQPVGVQNKFKKVFKIFENDQFHYTLNNHSLMGEFMGWRSINITGDIRVHYAESGDVIILMNIGSHSQLY